MVHEFHWFMEKNIKKTTCFSIFFCAISYIDRCTVRTHEREMAQALLFFPGETIKCVGTIKHKVRGILVFKPFWLPGVRKRSALGFAGIVFRLCCAVCCVLCVVCCQIFSKASDSCCCCSDSKTSVRPVGETHGMDSTKITVTNMRIIVEDQSKTAQGQMVCGTCWDCCKPCAECCCEACCGTKTIQSQERVRSPGQAATCKARRLRQAAKCPLSDDCLSLCCSRGPQGDCMSP